MQQSGKIGRGADPEIVAATGGGLARAAARLRAGGLVAFPTETVYGLGGDATDARAVAAVFAMKGRPRFNPLIIHVAGLAAAETYGVFDDRARRLAAAFWPGALTLVVPRRAGRGIAELATAGLDTVALRVPAHGIAQALLAAAGVPLAAPSANRSGRVSPTRAEHVAADLAGEPVLILDGGPTRHGIESTVVSVAAAHVVLLRPGAVTAPAIAAVLGEPLARAAATSHAPASPGMLPSHYAPRAAVRMHATTVDEGEALLAFGPHTPPSRGPVRNLSPSGDLHEAAANLFAALRHLDASGAGTIAVMAIPDTGLGEAINDRLRRAAAPR